MPNAVHHFRAQKAQGVSKLQSNFNQRFLNINLSNLSPVNRTKWTDRVFNFDLPEGWIFDVLERLRGTEVRLRAMTANLCDAQLCLKEKGKWSIKEEIGHLSDLEELHDGRIDDFLQRKETLRAADMKNAKTEAAGHNKKTLNELIEEFSRKRNEYVKRLEALDDETQRFKSIHPRLKIPARPVDMAYFTAEHDDHHLTSIRQILQQL